MYILLVSRRTRGEIDKMDDLAKRKGLKTRVTFSKFSCGIYIPDGRDSEGCYNLWEITDNPEHLCLGSGKEGILVNG